MRKLENKVVLYKNEQYKVIKEFSDGFYMIQNVQHAIYIELVLYKDIASCTIVPEDFAE
ncbi:hypothetical protein [Paenisporosarcina antarctica]|uniref:hypothetical protein n=1 Tax=Paenisporosarcina antarctica TaxID=417367 RepID=UPI001416F95D|nr:hypothetical protein [Paenisporosarcina antarctica]